MKRAQNEITISAMVIICFITFSCKKNDGNLPSTPAGIKFTVNGTTYSATTQVGVPDDSSFTNGTFKATLPSGGGYISYMYSNSKLTPYLYQYLFAQENLAGVGDTIRYSILLSSQYPITTGEYAITGAINTDSVAKSNQNLAFYASVNYTDTKTGFSDSTAMGTLIIEAMNGDGTTLSGTFNFIAKGRKGSVPATDTITNGQFVNIPFQQF